MPRFAANLGCTPLEPMKAPPDEAPPPVTVINRVSAPVSEVRHYQLSVYYTSIYSIDSASTYGKKYLQANLSSLNKAHK